MAVPLPLLATVLLSHLKRASQIPSYQLLQGVVTPIHAMNPSATGVKVKSKGQHPFPGEVKWSWCFCSFSQMVKTEGKVKIPSAELVASLITTD